MPLLFEKSGAEGQCRRFKFEMPKLAEKDDLPGYELSVETAKDGEPMIRMPGGREGRRADVSAQSGQVARTARPMTEAITR
jgi:hypothetical protein